VTLIWIKASLFDSQLSSSAQEVRACGYVIRLKGMVRFLR
jgi:hypothetical protein